MSSSAEMDTLKSAIQALELYNIIDKYREEAVELVHVLPIAPANLPWLRKVLTKRENIFLRNMEIVTEYYNTAARRLGRSQQDANLMKSRSSCIEAFCSNLDFETIKVLQFIDDQIAANQYNDTKLNEEAMSAWAARMRSAEDKTGDTEKSGDVECKSSGEKQINDHNLPLKGLDILAEQTSTSATEAAIATSSTLFTDDQALEDTLEDEYLDDINTVETSSNLRNQEVESERNSEASLEAEECGNQSIEDTELIEAFGAAENVLASSSDEESVSVDNLSEDHPQSPEDVEPSHNYQSPENLSTNGEPESEESTLLEEDISAVEKHFVVDASAITVEEILLTGADNLETDCAPENRPATDEAVNASEPSGWSFTTVFCAITAVVIPASIVYPTLTAVALCGLFRYLRNRL